jgi:hypothetical protein
MPVGVPTVVQKIALTAIADQAHNSNKLEATPARTHGQAAVWVALNSVGSLLHADAHPSIVRPSGSCLRIFVSAIASKTRKLTSAAALPLSTASLNLKASLSQSCSTAATKRSLFRPTAFAKSQRGSHECRSCDLSASDGRRLMSHKIDWDASQKMKLGSEAPLPAWHYSAGSPDDSRLLRDVLNHGGERGNGKGMSTKR